MADETNTGSVQAEGQIKTAVATEEKDFLAGVEAADPESFNVCISCD